MERENSIRGEQRHLPDGAVLLDASTIDLLASHQVYHSLTKTYFADERIAGLLYGILLKQIKGDRLDTCENEDAYALNHALSFLELWVLSEEVFVDVRALKSLERSHSRDKVRALSPLFQKTAIHDQIQEEAANRVATFYRHLSTSDDPLLAKVSQWKGWDFDLCLKDDYYAKLNAHLSVSANSRIRSIFYFELSRMLDVPLFLHPQKSQYLKEMGQAFQHSRSVVYGKLVDEVRQDLFYSEKEITVPPIADEIIRVARERGISFIEAAREIRNTKELAGLRKCVAELCRLGAERSNVEQNLKIREEAKQIAGRIEAQWDTQGRISRRRIDVAELPWIGSFLKAMNYRPTVYVRDFDLSQRPFVVLFSRWANDVLRRSN